MRTMLKAVAGFVATCLVVAFAVHHFFPTVPHLALQGHPVGHLLLMGAVTPSTITDLTDLAKDLFTNYYVPQMGKKTPLKAQFDQLEQWDFAGKKIIFGMKLETGGGASNAGAHKKLPDNADGSYDQADTTLVRTYVRLAIDAFLMEITKQQKGSYRPAVEEKMDDRMTALIKEINRQLYSDGTGKLARTPTGAAGATQTIDLAFNQTNGGNPARYIYKGDYLAFYDNVGALIGKRKVLSKSATLGSSTATITLDSTITSVTNGWIAKATADDDNTQTGELKGLLAGMVQSGTFQSVPIGSTYQAMRLNNGGTLQDVNDSLMAQLFNMVQVNSDEYPNLIVTRTGIVQRYSEIFLPIRRINGQDVALKGGYKPLATFQFAGGEAPILTDNDCPGSRVFALNTSYIKKLDLIGEQWAAFDGAQFTRVTDEDGAEGYIRKYHQICWQRLNVHGVLEDIQDIAAVDRLYS